MVPGRVWSLEGSMVSHSVHTGGGVKGGVVKGGVSRGCGVCVHRGDE